MENTNKITKQLQNPEFPSYIKVIDVDVLETYSCDVCGKWFNTDEELKLGSRFEPNGCFETYLSLCFSKCKFKFVYSLIKKLRYSKENYEVLLKIIGVNQTNYSPVILCIIQTGISWTNCHSLNKGSISDTKICFNCTSVWNSC